MIKQLLVLSIALLSFSYAFNQTILEDFEGGSQIGWNTEFGDGTFMVVDNPAVIDTTLDPLNINRSAQVGSYVKGATAFSLLISQLDAPLDLSTDNKFKVQIYASAPTAILFKIEGDGEAWEVRKNIAVGTTERWVEYSFDMSAAASFTTINKIILFFDPGNAESTDTYLFDNLTVEAADECAGVAAVDGVVDDFECQRNISVGIGFTDLTAVDNPDASGINTSSKVGRYNDFAGSGAFSALVYDYGEAGIPLETNNLIKIKVWAPVAGRLLFKLEGGASPNAERDAQITTLNQWVEYSIDFSDLAGANFTRLVFFFNAGVDPEQDDIYFIDDVLWEEAPSGDIIEDFEDGGKLSWAPLLSADGSTFEIIANPDMTGNESANIGSFTKGTSDFGGATAILTNGIDLSTFSQINMQVWAPEGATTVTMQLVSALQGNKEITRDITSTGEWIELNFNFEEFKDITDFSQVNIIFDSGIASSSTYFFDNLSVGRGTVDPCEGVEPIANIVDDFDCQRNIATITDPSIISAIANPDASGINPDPLDKVGQYIDPFDEFSALVYDYGQAMDLANNNQLTMKIWSPAIVPLGFKLEGGATSNPVEITADVTAAETWVEYVIDFSDQAEADHTRLVIFFNFAVVQEEQLTYFVDDIEWKRAPLGEEACLIDFEESSGALNPTVFGYFGNGSETPEFTVIDNPDVDGINTSARVGVFVEKGVGDGLQPWAGMFSTLDAPIQLSTDNKTMSMHVWGSVAGTMVMKLEGGLDGAMNSGDVLADYTTPNEWQKLTWNFADVTTDEGQYGTFTIILGFGEIPTEDRTFYFDNVEVGASDTEESCVISQVNSLFGGPVVLDALNIAPNPVTNVLNVFGAQNVYRYEVVTLMGQRLQLIQTTGQPNVEVNVSQLPNGMYLLNGFDEKGRLIANGKFIKQ